MGVDRRQLLGLSAAAGLTLKLARRTGRSAEVQISNTRKKRVQPMGGKVHDVIAPWRFEDRIE